MQKYCVIRNNNFYKNDNDAENAYEIETNDPY